MKIKIQGIKGRGEPDNERVVLKVLTDADIGRYLLSASHYTDETAVSTKLSRTFWFPDRQLKQGDFVILYTKAGTATRYNNKSESVTHVFYLGSSEPIWTEQDKAVILFETAEWAAKRTSEQG